MLQTRVPLWVVITEESVAGENSFARRTEKEKGTMKIRWSMATIELSIALLLCAKFGIRMRGWGGFWIRLRTSSSSANWVGGGSTLGRIIRRGGQEWPIVGRFWFWLRHEVSSANWVGGGSTFGRIRRGRHRVTDRWQVLILVAPWGVVSKLGWWRSEAQADHSEGKASRNRSFHCRYRSVRWTPRYEVTVEARVVGHWKRQETKRVAPKERNVTVISFGRPSPLTTRTEEAW